KREHTNEQGHEEERMGQRPDGAEGRAGEAIGHLAAGEDDEQAQMPAHELTEVTRQKTGSPDGADSSHERAAPSLDGGLHPVSNDRERGVDSIGRAGYFNAAVRVVGMRNMGKIAMHQLARLGESVTEWGRDAVN